MYSCPAKAFGTSVRFRTLSWSTYARALSRGQASKITVRLGVALLRTPGCVIRYRRMFSPVYRLAGIANARADSRPTCPVLLGKRSSLAAGGTSEMCRVEVWRGGCRSTISVCRPFRLAVPHWAAPGSVSTSPSSNRTCRSPASGSRTRLHAFAFACDAVCSFSPATP